MTTLDSLRSTAAEQAALLGSAFVGSEHLFLAWLETGDGPAHEAAAAAGLTVDQFRTLISARAANGRGQSAAGEGGLSSHAQRVVNTAEEIAKADGRDTADGDDVFLALIREPRGAVARALTEAKLKPSQLRNLVRPGAPKVKQPKREPRGEPRTEARQESGSESDAAEVVATPAPRRERTPAPARERVERVERPERSAKLPKRDPEIDDIPESRPPERPRLATPPRPAPLPVAQPARRWSWLWLFYLGIPASIAMQLSGGSATVVFIAACIAIVPLAGAMATATNHLADRTGPAIGGLLNAAFGNATEIIVAIVALNAGYVDLVKASLAGSILSNLLLILGLGFIAGGRGQRTLRFDRTAAGMSGIMLALAVAGLVLPSMFAPLIGVTHLGSLSQMVSIVLIVTYLLSLVFTLRTHPISAGHSASARANAWPLWIALAVLAVTTAGVAFESEILVRNIDQVTASWHLSALFLGFILIPIIGNAAEHATAIVAARDGRTELAVQIAVGSSTQVALLIAPLLVLLSVTLGHGMDLVFSTFQLVTLGVGVIISTFVTLDGESHWFEGVQLVALYLMIAAAAWFI